MSKGTGAILLHKTPVATSTTLPPNPTLPHTEGLCHPPRCDSEQIQSSPSLKYCLCCCCKRPAVVPSPRSLERCTQRVGEYPTSDRRLSASVRDRNRSSGRRRRLVDRPLSLGRWWPCWVGLGWVVKLRPSGWGSGCVKCVGWSDERYTGDGTPAQRIV